MDTDWAVLCRVDANSVSSLARESAQVYQREVSSPACGSEVNVDCDALMFSSSFGGCTYVHIVVL
jgi:hypothetical protein